MDATSSDGRLTVFNGNWGRTSLASILAVLESAHGTLTSAFGVRPDAPIRVCRWNQDHPRVVHDRRPYQIFLSTGDTYWSQYVFQFSHELCHVLTGFERYREHHHKWFEESLCELASLFVLHRLADDWKLQPPPGVYRAAEFAPNHRTYALTREQQHSAPVERDLPAWYSENFSELEANPYDRIRTGIVAAALRPRFLQEPSLWVACRRLNSWDPNGDETFGDYLDSWCADLRRNGLEIRTPEMVRGLLLPQNG